MTPEQFAKLIEHKAADIAQAMNRTLPIKAGSTAVSHFKDNFRQGGFVNGGLQRWKPSKRLSATSSGRHRKGKAKRGRTPAANRYKTLLSSRNHLYNSTRYIPSPGEVRIINEVPYAIVHNEGRRAGRGKGFQMPRRQFIGESRELNQKVAQLIEDELQNILK
jgi:phage gpG-like protein